MDRRLKTAALAALLSLAAVPAWAQQYQYDGDTSYEQAQETPAQRNPGVPKGLTLVPWKLERREDSIEVPGISRNNNTSTVQSGKEALPQAR